MSETLNDDNRQGTVENRAPQPKGILPRNTQAVVIAGISLVMVAAFALSGPTSSKSAAKTASPQGPLVMDPNQARIAEYRQRLDDQARKLQAEQAQVAQAKQQLAANGMPAGGSPVNPTAGSGPEQQRTEENAIQDDKKRREYASLFSSNLALSYRKDNPPSPQGPASGKSGDSTTPSAGASATPYGNLLPLLSALAQTRNESAARGEQPSQETAPKESESVHKSPHDAKNRFADLDHAEGKDYRLFEGTVLETVLTNRLTSTFNGPVNCMVTTNIYSHDRQHVLIPQGSRILGEAKRLSNFGEERLAVVFHRVIMPDGYSLSLDQFKGLNQIGETGLRDQVNHHYMQIFGVSLAVGAIAGLAEANTGAGLVQSSSDAYRQGVASSLSQSSLRILDRYLNVLPTVTIREGHRVKVYLSDDLLVPAYENHRMPGDL